MSKLLASLTDEVAAVTALEDLGRRPHLLKAHLYRKKELGATFYTRKYYIFPPGTNRAFRCSWPFPGGNL